MDTPMRARFVQFLVAFIISIQPVFLNAQVAIPNDNFQPGQVIASGESNANFGTLADQALNRTTGGIVTGHITVDLGITIDGADIGEFLSNGRVRAQSGGTAATVALGPTSAGNTGMYFPAAGQVAWSLAGTQRLLLNSSGLTVYGNLLVNSSGKIPALTTTYFASVAGGSVQPGESSIADGALLARLAAGETITGQWEFNPGSIGANTPTRLLANWDNAGVAFTGLQIDITSTASAAASAPLTAKVAGSTHLNISKAGKMVATSLKITSGAAANYFLVGDSTGTGFWAPSATNSPVPSGMLAWFEASCPATWTIKSDALNTYASQFFRGGGSFAVGGGATTHGHLYDPPATISDAPSNDHTHNVDPPATVSDASSHSHGVSGAGSSGLGGHTHGFTTDQGGGQLQLLTAGAASISYIDHTHTGTTDSTSIAHTHGDGSYFANDGGSHSHTTNYPLVASGNRSVSHTHTVDITEQPTASFPSNDPAYVQIVICRKD